MNRLLFGMSLLLFCLCMGFYHGGNDAVFAQQTHLVINQPATSLLDSNSIYKQPLITELLYGESVTTLQDDGSNLFIEAPDLLCFETSAQQWKGFQGTINKEHVTLAKQNLQPTHVIDVLTTEIFQDPSITSTVMIELYFGTKLNAKAYNAAWLKVNLIDGSIGFIQKSAVFALSKNHDPEVIRKRLVQLTPLFLKVRYKAGGRTLHRLNCSGFTNLLYEACGLTIALKAHDQYLQTRPIDGSELEEGDLIFTQSQNSKTNRMTHVLMYIGQNLVAEESFYTLKEFAINNADNRFGVPLQSLKNGAYLVDCYGKKKRIFFGSFFSDKSEQYKSHLKIFDRK